MENINWFAQVAATLSALVIGFGWYHEKVFGNVWMKMVGLTPEKIQQANMALTMGLTVVFAFLLSMVMFAFTTTGETHVGKPEFHTFQHGVVHGLVMTLFVVLPTLGTNALFEQKNWKYILINVGYWALTLSVMGGIISLWR
jgi:hypothetical protein